MNIELNSFRNFILRVLSDGAVVPGQVLIRSSDDPAATVMFTHDGQEYPVVVTLDTINYQIAIAVKEPIDVKLVQAAAEKVFGQPAQLHDNWGEGVQMLKSNWTETPPKKFYINDARLTAEAIDKAMQNGN